MNRRDFLTGAAASAGAMAVGGLGAADGKPPFYGPTVRDRLWMWGHHVTCAKIAWKDRYPGQAVDQAEGCRLMGIPNNCVIRWCGLPTYPWGDYFEQFRKLKRITFGIHATDAKWTEGNLRLVFDRLQPTCPNLTGCFLDDYFLAKKVKDYVPDIGLLEKVSGALQSHGLRLSVVAYGGQASNPKFKPHFALFDEVSVWFYESGKIPKMDDTVRAARDFLGPEKDLLLGLYMWDFSRGEPVAENLMRQQLGFAERLLADRTVTGLVFHPTFAAALDVPSVTLAKAWIAEHGDRTYGQS